MKKQPLLSPSSLLAEIDALIVAGQTEYAQGKLDSIPWNEIPKNELVDYARLARRLHLPDLSLSLLHPIVRSSIKRGQKATPREKAEYAAALIQIGAIKEADQILSALQDARLIDIPLYQAYARIACWDYRSTTPLLERYLESKELSHYERAIGEINLGAALVHEGQDGAAVFLETFLTKTTGKQYHRLRGHAWLLLAEWMIGRLRWNEVQHALNQVELIFDQPDMIELLFVRKWKAVALLARERTESALHQLRLVKSEAVEKRNWETVRDCDFHEAVYLKKKGNFTHLYFGTPYVHYRENLLSLFGAEMSLPVTYDWKFGEESDAKALSINIYDGSLDLKVGTLLHCLFGILCSDFYRPLRVADIHDGLYPGEFFNPETSPNRVHQALQRLRKWFLTAGLPLSLQEFRGAYSLKAEKPCRIVVQKVRPEMGSGRALLDKLRIQFPSDREFTLKQASLALDIPPASAQKLLRAASNEGHLQREGKARHSRYRFV